MAAQNTFQILPEEVWLDIFNKISDAQDWLNLSRTCTSLQNIVKSESIQALFTQVLTHVGKYLPKKNLLISRLVCRKWKAAVDQLIELELKSSQTVQSYSAFKPYKFSTSDKIDRFLADMGNHDGNPFVGRAVKLVGFNNILQRRPQVLEEFWPKCKQLLERFGTHIRILSLVCYPEISYDKELIFYLYYVPDVVVLEIIICTHMLWLFSLDVGLYPTLRQLQILKLARNEVSQAFEILKSIHKLCKYPEKVTQLFVPGLFESMKIFKNIEIVHTEFVKSDFKAIRCTQWPLKAIYANSETRHVFRTIFFNFGSFRNTLKKLVLRPCVEIKNIYTARMEFPKLEHLELAHVVSSSLDFLIELKSLQVLSINWQKRHRGSEIIRIFGILDSMYSSNIWEILPRLKIFRLKFRRGYYPQEKWYTRDELNGSFLSPDKSIFMY